MKLIFTHLFIFFASILCFGQINEKDSLVNVKTFWNVNDVKSYTFYTKETHKSAETENQEEIAYKVKISVDDIYEDEMTITWLYDTVRFNANKFVNNPLYLVHHLPIRFVIDAEGRFLHYVDLDKTIDRFKSSAAKIETRFEDQPEIQSKINELVTTYATTENIIKIVEKDIRQFHLFYGKGEYKLNGGSTEFTSYMDNLFTPSPTPAKTFISLKDIAFTGTNYTMNAVQLADEEWLSNSWFNYLVELSEKLEQDKPDESRKTDKIIYTVNTSSRIKDNGWLSYSIETKKVNFQDTDYTLQRTIEID